jgi:hypothetical protein
VECAELQQEAIRRSRCCGSVDSVDMIANMKASLSWDERIQLTETLMAEILIWSVPQPVRGSAHRFKYSLALISYGVCVMRYDNEAGKGDHKHLGERQFAYMFSTIKALQEDFWSDVAEFQKEGRR